MIERRQFLTLLGGAALAQGARRPNILLILADDLGYGELSCYGSRDIPTPHIDSLAKRGVRFTDGYMTAAVCNPSRAGLLTGRHQQRWGQELNRLAEKNWLPANETCVAEVLKKSGYATSLVGKWQMGQRPGFHPLDRGFDEFFGMASGANYADPKRPDVKSVELGGGDGLGGLFRGRESVQEPEYLTDAFAREANRFIGTKRDNPFFLYLACNSPHVPLQVTRKYYDRFPGIVDETRRIYAGMVSALDDAVGSVLATLEQTGKARDTLVVFSSDNGAPDYVQKTDNGGLTGYKRMLYEGGIRVPMIMRWDGRLPAGSVVRDPVSALDFLPTFRAAAGITEPPPKPFDGVDLLPYLTGRKKGAAHELLFWRMGANSAVRKGKWKLHRVAEGSFRLFNLEKDREENENVAEANPKVVADLKEALANWNANMTPPIKSKFTTVTNYRGDRIEWDY